MKEEEGRICFSQSFGVWKPRNGLFSWEMPIHFSWNEVQKDGWKKVKHLIQQVKIAPTWSKKWKEPMKAPELYCTCGNLFQGRLLSGIFWEADNFPKKKGKIYMKVDCWRGRAMQMHYILFFFFQAKNVGWLIYWIHLLQRLYQVLFFLLLYNCRYILIWLVGTKWSSNLNGKQ